MLESFSIISQSLTISNRLSINILAGSLLISSLSAAVIGMDNDSLLVIYLYLGRRHVKDYRMIDQINQSVSLITNR